MTLVLHRMMPLAVGIVVLLPLSLPASAIVAGDPNPPKDSSSQYLYPPDNPNNPYNLVTQTGRLDTLSLSSPFSGVGTIDGGTGTLLDSTHVLTAAHLFGASNSHPQGITFNLDSGNGVTASFAASRIDVAPGFAGVGQNDDNDIAIVTLATPVPTTFKTYHLDNSPLTAGTTLTLVGYGQTGDGVNGYSNNYGGGRRVGKNNADAYLQTNGDITTAYQPGDKSYVFDFDGPTTGPNQVQYNQYVQNIGGTTLGNDVETTIGVGDSGGPAFVMVNGQYEIAAINNFLLQFGTTANPGPTYGHFGSGGGGAIVSAYSSFINPILAPEPGPLMTLGIGAALLLAAVRRRSPSEAISHR